MDSGNRDANEPGAGAVGNGVWGSDGVSASEASIALLRRDLIEAQQEAKFWKERAETLRVENLRTNIELESTRKDLSQAQAELIRELRTKLESTKTSGGCKCGAYSDSLEKELNSTKMKLTQMEDDYENQRKLVEELRREKSQGFLNKADSISIAQVGQKVDALNEEISRMAAYLGEVLFDEILEPHADRQGYRETQIKGASDCAKRMLGETLANELAKRSMNEPHEQNNLVLVQIVMRIALTHWCCAFERRWTSYQSMNEEKQSRPEGSGGKPGISQQIEYHKFVFDLYNRIRDHEDQAVASHWRSLTRTHIPFSTTGWDRSLMITIYSIMSVAGWATHSRDEDSGIKKRLGPLFKPLFDLRKALGEDVTSADLGIAVIRPGQTFEPSYMEDEYGDGGSSSTQRSAFERVIGTSGCGLERITVKKLSAGGVQREAEILLMPKVVLEKTIKEVLNVSASTRNKKLKKATSRYPGAGKTGF